MAHILCGARTAGRNLKFEIYGCGAVKNILQQVFHLVHLGAFPRAPAAYALGSRIPRCRADALGTVLAKALGWIITINRQYAFHDQAGASSSLTEARPVVTTTAFSCKYARQLVSTRGNTNSSIVPVRSSMVVKAINVLDFVVMILFLTTVHTRVTVWLSKSLAFSPCS